MAISRAIGLVYWVWGGLALLITGCASSTISDHLDISVLGDETKEATRSGIISGIQITGGGLDIGTKLFCHDDASCHVFGDENKSYSESTDFVALKLDQNDHPIWANIYGGSHKDSLSDVVAAKDGGFLLAGNTQSLFFTSLPGERHAIPILVKISDRGEVQWAKIFYSSLTSVISAVQTRDGGFVVLGTRAGAKDHWVMVALKVDPNGELVWAKDWSRDGADVGGRGLVELADGSLMIGGQVDIANSIGLLFMRIQSDGTQQWHRMFVSTDTDMIPNVSGVRVTNKGVLAFGPIASKSSPNEDMLLLNLSQDGDLTFFKKYSDGEQIFPHGAASAENDSILIYGTSRAGDQSPATGIFVWVDADGGVLASSIIGGGEQYIIPNDVEGLSQGRYNVLLMTDGQKNQYADMSVLTWLPDRNGPSLTSGAVETMQQDIDLVESDAALKDVDITHELDVTALKVRPLTSP